MPETPGRWKTDSAVATPDTQPASFVPTWMDSLEPVSVRSEEGIPLPTPVMVSPDSESRVFDMTEADTDSNEDSQDTRMCDPVQTADVSDTLVDALERDLENNASANADPHSGSVACQ